MCLTGFHKNNTTPHANQKHLKVIRNRDICNTFNKPTAIQ